MVRTVDSRSVVLVATSVVTWLKTWRTVLSRRSVVALTSVETLPKALATEPSMRSALLATSVLIWASTLRTTFSMLSAVVMTSLAIVVAAPAMRLVIVSSIWSAPVSRSAIDWTRAVLIAVLSWRGARR